MNVVKRIQVPTGDILIVQGEYGYLECLSLGDYGKDVNIKADFLGVSREPSAVRHTKLLPLTEKWVITVSTQYGCACRCNFCDVPRIKYGGNATFTDLINQVEVAMKLHPEIKSGKRLNLHYARMGEPTWNDSVLESAEYLADYWGDDFGFHPVVSTMMPEDNPNLYSFLYRWMRFKNEIMGGEAGLQLSINSTNNTERNKMFDYYSMDLIDVADIMRRVPRPIGRKITLNFAVADYEIDAERLFKLFSPEDFIVKLTPMHKTRTAVLNDVKTAGDYTEYFPYKEYEENLKAVGFDVLVFIASKEEDEGRITCGNAILSGTLPFSNVISKPGVEHVV